MESIALNSPTYAAVLAGSVLVFQNALMLSVGMYRTTLKKGVGTDGDIKLERLVRRHGNLAENAGLFVAALATYEILYGQTSLALWTALLFALFRALHAIGFSNEAGSHLVDVEGARTFFLVARSSGAIGTALTSFALGGGLVYQAIQLIG